MGAATRDCGSQDLFIVFGIRRVFLEGELVLRLNLGHENDLCRLAYMIVIYG